MSEFDDFMNKMNGAPGGNPLSGTNSPGAALSGQPTTNELAQQERAQSDVESAADSYNSLTPPSFSPVNYQGVGASTVGPSAMGGVSTNPGNNAAQQAQMTALSRLAANGGRSAASDANLASIQANENANAKGQRDAIMQGAEARGQGGSGASLLAQLSASQNATNNQSAEDLGVAGNNANTAINAGQGAAAIGSNMENQQFGEGAAKAQAADAVARFNAGQTQSANTATAAANNASQTMNNYQMPQQTYADQAQKAGGQAGAYEAGAGYYGQQAGIAAQKQGNQTGALAGLGAAAIAASTGGRIPGSPVTPGNSTLNDFVPIKASPGEVVVPRSLALGGSTKDIGNFVKNAPTAPPAPTNPGSNQNKEAMLSALRNIANKRRAA